MFFTITAAIGGAMTAGIWLGQDGLAAAGLAALTAGLTCAATAAALVGRLDRRTRAAGPETVADLTTDDRPRLARRRGAASLLPGPAHAASAP